MCNCMQHGLYYVQQHICEFGEASGGIEEDSACFLCRSMFSDQPKTHACLRVSEALSVSVRGEGEGACDSCMYVCV